MTALPKLEAIKDMIEDALAVDNPERKKIQAALSALRTDVGAMEIANRELDAMKRCYGEMLDKFVNRMFDKLGRY